METISFDTIHNWWDGKVKIRKMKPFEDSRGLLCEVFRSDSDSFKNIVNTYISETAPFVKRGPHEHNFQDDEFITWNSRMVYEFFNEETKEYKYFITEPKGIFSIYVEHNIHHGYRNLDSKNISYTMNSLNKLYKGFGRNDEADEIRHEKKTMDNKILFIFGASGKLGKALTKVAYDNIGQHTYEVVPCFDKILNETEFTNFVNSIQLFKGRDVTFINCAALTNTKEVGSMNDAWRWSNVSLPAKFANLCSENNWNFVQLSSNYVYHKVKPNIINYHLSTYTESKKSMEFVLSNSKLPVSVLRVSNLYHKEDTEGNIFLRFKEILKEKGSITVDYNEMVGPTDVEILSQKIVEMFKADTFKVKKFEKFNIISSDSCTLKEFVEKNFNVTPLFTENKVSGNFNEFISDNTSNIIKI